MGARIVKAMRGALGEAYRPARFTGLTWDVRAGTDVNISVNRQKRTNSDSFRRCNDCSLHMQFGRNNIARLQDFISLILIGMNIP